MLKKIFSREIILYVVFGVLTTLLNIAVFYAMNDVGGINWYISNICAWVAGVIFAYITNKLFVFRSKEFTGEVLLKESLGFLFARLITLGIDMLIMWILIDLAGISGTLWEGPVFGLEISLSYETVCKFFVNFIVIAVNYIFSKFIIFKKGESIPETEETV